MRKIKYEKVGNYNKCINCKAELGYGASSKVHARTLDQVNYRSSFAWCYECEFITHYTKPYLYRLLKLPILRAKKALTLEQIYKDYHKFDTNEDNYEELIWQISRCLVYRAGENNPKRELIAWNFAKQKLQPFHLIMYLKIIRDQRKITPKETLQFMLEFKEGFQNQIDSRLYNLINSNIEELTSILNRN
jgi:hypothetical protein